MPGTQPWFVCSALMANTPTAPYEGSDELDRVAGQMKAEVARARERIRDLSADARFLGFSALEAEARSFAPLSKK